MFAYSYIADVVQLCKIWKYMGIWSTLSANGGRSTLISVSYTHLWINPVAKGVPEITKSETMQQIRDLVKEDPKAIWLVADMAYPATNIPAMAGADCLNTTQTYPQKTRWEMLDQEGECEDIYNRYCHIRASLGSKTMLELSLIHILELCLVGSRFWSASFVRTIFMGKMAGTNAVYYFTFVFAFYYFT